MAVDISVIVPVFRVERYLEECVNSILAQEMQSFELILVDDGSDDNCPQICDNYAEMDSRVRVIHQKNQGLAAGRNAGMKIAQGRYIAFCDSDDQVKKDMLSKALIEMESRQADVLIFGYQTIPDGREHFPGFSINYTNNPMDLILDNPKIHSQNEFCFSCRFMFRRKFLLENSLYFDEEILIGEDMPFNTECIMSAKEIAILHESLYIYRTDNQNSIMHARYKPNLANKLELQYGKKLAITQKYGLHRKKAWMDDMAYYYMTAFSNMLFTNTMQEPREIQRASIHKILRLSLIQDNYRRSISLLFSDGIKTGLFRIFCLFKWDGLVYYFLKKWHGEGAD